MLTGLIFAAAVAAAQPRPPQAVAVVRARIVSGVRISFSTLPPKRPDKARLIEFE